MIGSLAESAKGLAGSDQTTDSRQPHREGPIGLPARTRVHEKRIQVRKGIRESANRSSRRIIDASIFHSRVCRNLARGALKHRHDERLLAEMLPTLAHRARMSRAFAPAVMSSLPWNCRHSSIVRLPRHRGTLATYSSQTPCNTPPDTVELSPAILLQTPKASMTSLRRVSWLLVALCSFTACAESGRQVTRQELGDRWPLTVDSGHVDCESGALIFRYHGTSYALNMIALGKGHQGIEPIWKSAAGSPNQRPLKLDLTPLIDLARQQCR
jgi:hypothetical protein